MTSDELRAALTAAGWHRLNRDTRDTWEYGERTSEVLGIVDHMIGDRYLVSAVTDQGLVRLRDVPASQVLAAYAAASAAVDALPVLR